MKRCRLLCRSDGDPSTIRLAAVIRAAVLIVAGAAVLICCAGERLLAGPVRIVCRSEAWKTPALPVEVCAGLVVAMLVVVVSSAGVGVSAIKALAVVVGPVRL